MSAEARNGANSAGRIPVESGAEDLPVPGPAEGTAGAHGARTPGPPSAEQSRGHDEGRCTAYQRAKTKDGIGRYAANVAGLRQ